MIFCTTLENHCIHLCLAKLLKQHLMDATLTTHFAAITACRNLLSQLSPWSLAAGMLGHSYIQSTSNLARFLNFHVKPDSNWLINFFLNVLKVWKVGWPFLHLCLNFLVDFEQFWLSMSSREKKASIPAQWTRASCQESADTERDLSDHSLARVGFHYLC